ncbi:MAG: hypothetical protein C0467_30295 [Planctomycetaceae bacterium]|nr:hypothetical protein [Planctomycetaceae bacterium]
MIDMLQKMGSIGKRLAEAGREARTASASVAGELTDQMTRAVGAAAGEVVRAAVIGAVAAVVRGSQKQPFPVGSVDDTWAEHDTMPPGVDEHELSAETASTAPRTGWARATRMAGTALTVAAGAAASVPGGRLVAAGLGAVAAVATLAARAGEDTSS